MLPLRFAIISLLVCMCHGALFPTVFNYGATATQYLFRTNDSALPTTMWVCLGDCNVSVQECTTLTKTDEMLICTIDLPFVNAEPDTIVYGTTSADFSESVQIGSIGVVVTPDASCATNCRRTPASLATSQWTLAVGFAEEDAIDAPDTVYSLTFSVGASSFSCSSANRVLSPTSISCVAPANFGSAVTSPTPVVIAAVIRGVVFNLESTYIVSPNPTATGCVSQCRRAIGAFDANTGAGWTVSVSGTNLPTIDLAAEITDHVTAFVLQLEGKLESFDCVVKGGVLGGLNADGTSLSCFIAAGNAPAIAYFNTAGAVTVNVTVSGSILAVPAGSHSLIPNAVFSTKCNSGDCLKPISFFNENNVWDVTFVGYALPTPDFADAASEFQLTLSGIFAQGYQYSCPSASFGFIESGYAVTCQLANTGPVFTATAGNISANGFFYGYNFTVAAPVDEDGYQVVAEPIAPAVATIANATCTGGCRISVASNLTLTLNFTVTGFPPADQLASVQFSLNPGSISCETLALRTTTSPEEPTEVLTCVVSILAFTPLENASIPITANIGNITELAGAVIDTGYSLIPNPQAQLATADLPLDTVLNITIFPIEVLSDLDLESLTLIQGDTTVSESIIPCTNVEVQLNANIASIGCQLTSELNQALATYTSYVAGLGRTRWQLLRPGAPPVALNVTSGTKMIAVGSSRFTILGSGFESGVIVTINGWEVTEVEVFDTTVLFVDFDNVIGLDATAGASIKVNVTRGDEFAAAVIGVFVDNPTLLGNTNKTYVTFAEGQSATIRINGTGLLLPTASFADAAIVSAKVGGKDCDIIEASFSSDFFTCTITTVPTLAVKLDVEVIGWNEYTIILPDAIEFVVAEPVTLANLTESYILPSLKSIVVSDQLFSLNVNTVTALALFWTGGSFDCYANSDYSYDSTTGVLACKVSPSLMSTASSKFVEAEVSVGGQPSNRVVVGFIHPVVPRVDSALSGYAINTNNFVFSVAGLIMLDGYVDSNIVFLHIGEVTTSCTGVADVGGKLNCSVPEHADFAAGDVWVNRIVSYAHDVEISPAVNAGRIRAPVGYVQACTTDVEVRAEMLASIASGIEVDLSLPSGSVRVSLAPGPSKRSSLATIYLDIKFISLSAIDQYSSNTANVKQRVNNAIVGGSGSTVFPVAEPVAVPSSGVVDAPVKEDSTSAAIAIGVMIVVVILILIIAAVAVALCRRSQSRKEADSFVPQGFASSPRVSRHNIFDERADIRDEFAEGRAVQLEEVSLPSYSSDPNAAEREYNQALQQQQYQQQQQSQQNRYDHQHRDSDYSDVDLQNV